jgi:hypothetical protein
VTERQIHIEIERIRRAYKLAVTRSAKKRHVERCFCFARYTSGDDVERAARNNELARIDARDNESVSEARTRYHARLDALRARAGEWSDLIPTTHLEVS